MTRSNNCICIIDANSNFLSSYLAWGFSLFANKITDVFIATSDLETFKQSPLNSLLVELQSLGFIHRIYAIQFHLKNTDALLRQLECMELCENFREVNQHVHSLNYDHFVNVLSDSLIDVNQMKALIEYKRPLAKNKEVLFFNDLNDIGSRFLSVFITRDRFMFSTIQKFHNVVIRRNKKDESDIRFEFKKTIVNLDADVIIIEKSL